MSGAPQNQHTRTNPEHFGRRASVCTKEGLIFGAYFMCLYRGIVVWSVCPEIKINALRVFLHTRIRS